MGAGVGVSVGEAVVVVVAVDVIKVCCVLVRTQTLVECTYLQAMQAVARKVTKVLNYE